MAIYVVAVKLLKAEFAIVINPSGPHINKVLIIATPPKPKATGMPVNKTNIMPKSSSTK